MANPKQLPNGFIYERIDAAPVKDFFVSMLTRDLSLSDAILDLLDNCVDGIHRNHKKLTGKQPYRGKKAEIKISSTSFMIHDNCGGIPWNLHDYAFKMGRKKDDDSKKDGMVGVYGIGMKRAIFKMGTSCLISTQNGPHQYEVEITPEWIRDEDNWWLPVRKAKKSMKEDGTTIVVEDLRDEIKAKFGEDKKSFVSSLREAIETHYAFIIDKGFVIELDGEPIEPKPTKLVFKPPTKKEFVSPFIYRAKVGEVSVFLAVGFTRTLPTIDEIEADQTEKRRSSLDAGWTVLCNDRAIIYCDRTAMTGWGEANIPVYHTQFIAISGIVEFKGPPELLPTTTTKRGIDASSLLYLQVKNKMREGMRRFIDYTNNWKQDLQRSKEHIKEGHLLTFEEIKAEATKLKFHKISSGLKGEQFQPALPMPPRKARGRIPISFSRNDVDVKVVSNYLFDKEDVAASKVGEACFDEILRKAKKS